MSFKCFFRHDMATISPDENFSLGSRVGVYVIMKTMGYYIKGLHFETTLDHCIEMLLLAIVLLLLHGFVNFSNYGIHDYLHVACSVILCGFLQPTKFKIKQYRIWNNDLGKNNGFGRRYPHGKPVPKLHIRSQNKIFGTLCKESLGCEFSKINL